MSGAGTEHRKLAAIMFTDMVGYTALTQCSEALALELLEEHRRLLRALFPKFNGREVETTGDGFLVEFESAVEAARCAIEIQRTLATRNISVPADRRIELRIGLHVGDVVHKEGHVLGDGVNIAARLQPLAEPGGICVSVDVAHQIQHNLEASVVTLGPKELKNVAAPVEVCRIVLPWEKRTPSPVERSTPERREKKMRLVAAALAAVVILGGAAWWLHYLSGRPPKSAGTPQTNLPAPVARAVEAKSVAVLPFVNLSSDKENEYLSDGITEDLCTALTQVKGLRVPARTSCFVFKGKTEDIRKIGQQLNVATVLEGSVSKAGNKLRVSAQLINVADGFHLWATNYDREMTDILAIRSDIAQQVVAALRVQLRVEETQRIVKKPTESLEAYNCYLQGRFWWNKRTLEGLNKAIRQFQEAIALDPTYAIAHAGLADANALLARFGPVAPKDCFPQAKAAATKAVELDDQLSEGHVSLAFVKLMWDWDWPGAESEFKRAIELNPNNGTAHFWYSIYLRVMRRFDDGVAEMREAEAVDPLSSIIGAELGEALIVVRQYDLAVTQLQKNLERDPDFHVTYYELSRAYCLCAKYPEAIAAAKKSCELAPDAPFNTVALANAYAAAGQKAEAKQILDKLLEQTRHAYFRIASVYVSLGDKEQALLWLEKAYDERAYVLGYVNADPMFDRLRSEPRFIALLRKMGLQK
jgi:TolB-like protein/class 3 adenylate cyclase/Tfp pilus assembly protein PilF